MGRVGIDHTIMGGVPCIRGTRMPVATMLGFLGEGVTTDEVLDMYPQLVIDDILACTERVLNPAAHSGTPPLYKKEVQDALDLIAQLEKCLP